MMPEPAGRQRSRGGAPPGRRRRARLAAVQALYQMDLTGAPAAAIVAEFRRHRLAGELDGVPMDDSDIEFFAALVAGVGARQGEIDRQIAAALTPEWPIDRLDAVLKAILRAGVCELALCTDLPAKVTISEYMAVADSFFSAREPALVNAVLDHLARQLRGAGMGEAGDRGP
jgi:N utilization substance protein B